MVLTIEKELDMLKNRGKKTIAFGMALLLTAGVFSGCGAIGSDKDTVALVNGTAIKLDVLNKNFLLIEKTYKEIYGDAIMTEQIDGKSVKSIVLSETLDNLVDDALIAQELEGKGFKAADADVDKRYADFTENELDKNPDNKKFYEENGIGKDFIRNAIKSQIYVAEFEKRINDEVLLKSSDMDTQFKQYVVQVKARHILVEQESKAKEISDKLKNGGDFDGLARTESLDPGSAAKGGDLGYFKRGAMVKEFDSVAFTLKPGEVSAPVKTQFGYHIIKVDAQKTVQNMIDEGVSEDQMKSEKQAMIKDMIDTQIIKEKKRLRDQAKIEKFEDKLK